MKEEEEKKKKKEEENTRQNESEEYERFHVKQQDRSGEVESRPYSAHIPPPSRLSPRTRKAS